MAARSSNLVQLNKSLSNQCVPDPIFSQPSLILDQIFGHLSYTDVYKAASVSSAWFHFVANSTTCMEKVRVIISHESNETQPLPEAVAEIIKNPMKFENLGVIECFDKIELINDLFFPGHKKWKRVIIEDTPFENVTQLLDLLETLDSSVVELCLHNLTMLDEIDDERLRSSTFPKLKCLKASRVPMKVLELFKNTSNIEVLNIQCITHFTDASITSILSGNEKLKRLTIQGDVIEKLFSQEECLQEYKFKLKQIEVKSYLHPSQEAIRRNFATFTNMQRNLICMIVHEWMGLVLLYAMYDLHLLEELKFYGFDKSDNYIDWEKVQFSTNNRIQKFRLTHMYSKSPWFKAIIGGLAKIESVFATSMDQETLEFMGTIMKNLRGIGATDFTATDLSDKKLFPLLDRFYITKKTQGITGVGAAENEITDLESRLDDPLQERIAAKKAEDRSRLEELYLIACIESSLAQ